MNSLQVFNNTQFGQIRVTQIEGKAMFMANDIAKALGYIKPANAVSSHCKGVTVLMTPSPGGVQRAKYIPESDVYRLVMRSKLPQAEQFQDWVCEEVLPAIRKTGGYISDSTDETPEMIMAKALLVAQETIERMKKKQEKDRLVNSMLISKNEEYLKQLADQEDKVLFAKSVETSKQSVLIGELAKILNQNGIDIGERRLFEWLRNNNYLCSSRGDRYNLPTQYSMNLGLFEIKKTTINKPNGSILVSSTTKVTGKGCVYFVNKFLKNQVDSIPLKYKNQAEGQRSYSNFKNT